MKKLVLVIVSLLVFLPFNVSAETLDEYIAKAQKALQEQKDAQNKKAMTEKEKEEALAQRQKITDEISTIEGEISSLQDEIKKLEESIQKKDKEIKEIMKFVQVSNGESAYLEYAFGASSFTDFIYRVSVAEQLSNYNDELIEEYNNNIKTMETKQKELATKQTELNSKQKELNSLIAKLSEEIDGLTDASLSAEQEYKTFMSTVNYMKSLGCSGSDTLAACKAKIMPPSTGGGGSVTGGGNANGFYIPLTKGRVTQNWSSGYTDGHNAIDMSNYSGAPVYSITTGTVLARTTGCGENVVIILHNVGGQAYTTVFYHLATATVSRGQTVYYTTQIGTQGGYKGCGGCGCTGSHIDVKLFKGTYGIDFTRLTCSRSNSTSKCGARYNINPRVWLTQLPAVGGSFSSR